MWTLELEELCPMNAGYACEKVSGPAGRNDKTATGEMVERQGRFRVRCQSAWDTNCT